jgi:hypothetical protein
LKRKIHITEREVVATGHLLAAACSLSLDEASLFHTARVCHVALLGMSTTRATKTKDTIVRTRLFVEVKILACIRKVLVSNLD